MLCIPLFLSGASRESLISRCFSSRLESRSHKKISRSNEITLNVHAIDFERQTRQGAPEWIRLPERIGFSGFEHIAPAEAAPALLS